MYEREEDNVCMILFSPLVPPPDVEIISLRAEPLYAGTSLTLSCNVTLETSVNNNERVIIKWSIEHGGRFSQSETLRVSNNTYQRNLTIDPLAIEDGTFSCMGTIIGGSDSATRTSYSLFQVTGE